jgi:hypothetical protein
MFRGRLGAAQWANSAQRARAEIAAKDSDAAPWAEDSDLDLRKFPRVKLKASAYQGQGSFAPSRPNQKYSDHIGFAGMSSWILPKSIPEYREQQG